MVVPVYQITNGGWKILSLIVNFQGVGILRPKRRSVFREDWSPYTDSSEAVVGYGANYVWFNSCASD
jgi:hypothetical protein